MFKTIFKKIYSASNLNNLRFSHIKIKVTSQCLFTTIYRSFDYVEDQYNNTCQSMHQYCSCERCCPSFVMYLFIHYYIHILFFNQFIFCILLTKITTKQPFNDDFMKQYCEQRQRHVLVCIFLSLQKLNFCFTVESLNFIAA